MQTDEEEGEELDDDVGIKTRQEAKDKAKLGLPNAVESGYKDYRTFWELQVCVLLWLYKIYFLNMHLLICSNILPRNPRK